MIFRRNQPCLINSAQMLLPSAPAITFAYVLWLCLPDINQFCLHSHVLWCHYSIFCIVVKIKFCRPNLFRCYPITFPSFFIFTILSLFFPSLFCIIPHFRAFFKLQRKRRTNSELVRPSVASLIALLQQWPWITLHRIVSTLAIVAFVIS
jgi:hypothetical protein